MTLNNLAEQLPWLLRNQMATRPAANSLHHAAGIASSSAHAHAPTTAALMSAFHRESPPPASSNFSTASTAAAPRFYPTPVPLPSPFSSASTLVPSRRPGLSAASAPINPAVDRAMGNLPPLACSPSIAATDMGMAFFNTPSRRQQLPQELPQQSSLSHLASGSARGLATPNHTASAAAAAVSSSHSKRTKSPAATSPFFSYPSDIDLDDFDSVVDLTNEDIIPSSSPGHGAHDGLQLWQEDQTSHPAPASSTLSRRGKKRKSMEISDSPTKTTLQPKRKAHAGKDRASLSFTDDDFPDVNDIVAIASSSPFTTRDVPAKISSKTPLDDLGGHTAPARSAEVAESVLATQEEESAAEEATHLPPVLSYWPALRWKQHGIEEKLRKNAADYTKGLREKSSAAHRLQIKAEKEPLLEERHKVDSLVDEFRAYAALYNDQETLLSTITQAYQDHQDTEAEENRLDELSAKVQDREETLRSRLSAASINPADHPAKFDAGSPLHVVVPATQHSETATQHSESFSIMPQGVSRSNAVVPESPSQTVLQTQASVQREQSHQTFEGSQLARHLINHNSMDDNVPDYFDDDDLFNKVEALPSMPAPRYTSFINGVRSAVARQENSPPRATASSRSYDIFSDDFSDDVEMLQVAEDFEMQHTSSAENSLRSRVALPAPRQVLATTSANVGEPLRESRREKSRPPTSTSKRPSLPSELMRFPWSDEVRRALKDRFRMSGFRHNQLEAINATLAGKDAFVLMPTGGGKSLCYQLPAVIGSGKTSGVTLVLSPLLSLMQDQVDHLNALNIAASSFNSSTPAAARKHILSLFQKANPEHYLQLLYVTPEMINKSQQFLGALTTLYENKKFARIVIDEAHCVSQWGHDFRPDYKALGSVRRQFPNVPVMALTATATPNVIVDIMHNLSIEGCDVFSQSFNRPNIYYELRTKGKGCIDSIGELIRDKHSGQSGIVYTLSQKSTVSLAEKLRKVYGIAAHHYHAGIDADEKTQIQRDWQKGVIKVVVATIAFGMGIDKSDVRFVVHHYLPKSLEGYYQETGRAGRDGKQSDCYLYFGYGDIKNLRKFIDDSDGSHEQKQRQRDMLQRMVGFCENQQSCRRTEILRYFGEDFDGNACNKTCDNCRSDAHFNLTDFTKYALAVLRTVQESKSVTMVQCGDHVMGKKRLDHRSLDDTYGIAKHLEKHDVHMMIYRLLSEHALKEENKVNRHGMAIQYFKLGRLARDYFGGHKRLQMFTKGSNGSAAAGQKTTTTKSTAASNKAIKPMKKPKIAKGKAAAVSAAAVSTVDDHEHDGDSEFEKYTGPVHHNGYAKTSFVVSDDDDDAEDEYDDDLDAPPPRPMAKATPRSTTKTSRSTPVPPRQLHLRQYAYHEDQVQAQASRTPSRRHQTSPRQQQRLDLGGIMARDPGQSGDGGIDAIHSHIVDAFADEARRLEERIRNEKGLRVLFTESHLREMAIGWTDTLDKMRRIRGIDPDHVRRFGPKFVDLVQQFHATYQDMMGFGSDGPSGAAADDSPLLGPIGPARRPSSNSIPDTVVDLISSDIDEDVDIRISGDDDAGGGGGNGGSSASHGHLIASKARVPTTSTFASPATAPDDAARWRAELQSLQSQPIKSIGKSSGTTSGRSSGGGGGGGGVGSRKPYRRKSFKRGGGSFGGSGGSGRGRAASGSSVGRRRGSGASRAAGSRGGEIGIMPL